MPPSESTEMVQFGAGATGESDENSQNEFLLQDDPEVWRNEESDADL